MASDYEDDEPPSPPSAAPSPALQAFKGAFTDPGAQKWAGEVTTRLNDYFTRRQIADENEAVGQAFMNDVGQFKTGLVSMVQTDPHAVNVALDIIPSTMQALTASMPGRPPDWQEHGENLSVHIGTEVATAAVRRLAETHEGAARALLNDPRINTMVGESASGLDSYITMQAQARAADQDAAAERAQEAQVRAADTSALNYLSALYNPATGKLQFPDGWNQAIVADPRLPPAATVGVGSIYTRLRETGDAAQSDPFVVASHVAGIAAGNPPHPAEIMQDAGGSLRLADAIQLAHAAMDPAAQAYFGQLNNVIEGARQQLAPPENGAAGENAFSRFMNWLLPNAHGGGVNMNPNDPGYVLTPVNIQQFAPKPEDYVNPILGTRNPVASGGVRGEVRRPAGNMLADGRLDEKIGRLQDAEMQRLNEEHSGSGTFFRDLLEKGGGATIPLVPGPGETSG